MLEIAVDLTTQDTDESEKILKNLKEDVGSLLPIGDEIFIKSDIAVQDNILTLLVMYSRYNQSNQIREKLKKVLSNMSHPDKK